MTDTKADALDIPALWRLLAEAKTVAESHPPPHARYVVLRDGLWFTAMPCYGMHEPWWVVRTMAVSYPGVEAELVAMRDTDRWFQIAAFAALVNHADALLAACEAGREAEAKLEAFAANVGEAVHPHAVYEPDDTLPEIVQAVRVVGSKLEAAEAKLAEVRANYVTSMRLSNELILETEAKLAAAEAREAGLRAKVDLALYALRGPAESANTRMNHATVALATEGVAEWLRPIIDLGDLAPELPEEQP